MDRTPEIDISDFLDFTYKRLSKRYSFENPENIFLEDEKYKIFLKDMRELLKDDNAFQTKYCIINNINQNQRKLSDYKNYDVLCL